MANELHFPLFHGYVDRWLVSGVTETVQGRAPRQGHCLARAAGHPPRRAGGRRGQRYPLYRLLAV